MIVIYKYGQDLQVTKKSLKLKLDMVMHRQTSLVQQLAVKQLQVIYNTIQYERRTECTNYMRNKKKFQKFYSV